MTLEAENGNCVGCGYYSDIDGEAFPYTQHLTQKAVYVYLSGEEHSLSVGETDYVLAFDTADSRFIFRQIHTHTFDSAWEVNATHHRHKCTFDDCRLVSDAQYSELTGDELAASGYGRHIYKDFVCVCGAEDMKGCREYYINKLRMLIIGNKDAEAIRKKALADIEGLTTAAQIEQLYAGCMDDIDAIYKLLQQTVESSLDEVKAAMEEYRAILQTAHGYDITELEKEKESRIQIIQMDSSVALITEEKQAALASLKEMALQIARDNTCTEIDKAAKDAEVPTENVLKMASVAKKAISACDSFDEIFDMADWAKELIGQLGTQPTEPTEPTEPTKACPKCGRTHADDFFGRIRCFFNRVIDFFRNLFG